MIRATKQRATIREVLIKSGRPLSVAEVFGLARNQMPGMGMATVYRNLKSLQEDGEVTQVELPGQPSRWEIMPIEHHHHFLCNTCDKLFEIHGCLDGMSRLLPEGYTLEE